MFLFIRSAWKNICATNSVGRTFDFSYTKYSLLYVVHLFSRNNKIFDQFAVIMLFKFEICTFP